MGSEGAFDDDGIPPADQFPGAEGISPEILAACAAEPQNDVGNGRRLLNHFGNDLVHVRDVGWHAWSGDRWHREGGLDVAVRYAHQTAERVAYEADFIAASPSEQQAIDAAADAERDLAELEKSKDLTDEQKARKRALQSVVDRAAQCSAAVKGRQLARRKFAISSGNAGKLKGMLDHAAPYKTVTPSDLDADKLAINVENGTIVITSSVEPDPDAPAHSTATKRKWSIELRPHDRADMITKVAPVVYDPTATCPMFMASVERFQPIKPVRDFLQRYHGYAMTGLTGEQCLVFNYGTGSNWKSTFVEIVARVMGDYCLTLAFESLAGDNQKSGTQATPDLARLPGARLVRASEPERGVQFREALIKSLTGGEPMLVRHNFKDFFEFRPDFKLVLSGNHKPEIGGVDHGIWRRIRFVPWPVTISDKEKRPMDDVMRELWSERSGVLNWLLAGLMDYLDGGLKTPQEVIDATAAYREEQDPVGAFIADCVKDDPHSSSDASARVLYDAFAAWCWHNGVRAWKEKAFAAAMMQKGFKRERTKRGRVYPGLSLQNVPSRAPRRSDDNDPPHPADDEVP